MPRVAKKKDVQVGKKKNGYVMPESIPLGEVLTDLSKKQWKVGPSIGIGGFGEIYMATEGTKSTKKTVDYDYVVKIEPHANGPLFVEMHFYMRNAKMEQIKNFCKERGIKTLGMPHLIGSGSHEINGVKHRFIVIPRYGKDIWSFFLANNRCLPEHTSYRLALQMLDVYEYIHECTYVHGDLKGANILLGIGKGGDTQAYLVDFGLASHYTTKDYKPDAKKMHNGTIEYTSRDAHNGVPTMRGDLEILGYNLIHWLGASLPWERDNLLATPTKVQKSKEEFMRSIDAHLNQLFSKGVSECLKQFMKYVASMEYDQKPDYEKCRKLFQNGLKSLGKSNLGELELVVTKPLTNPRKKKARVERKDSSEDEISESPTKALTIPRKRKAKAEKDSSEDEISESPTRALRRGLRSKTKLHIEREVNLSKSPPIEKGESAASTPITSRSKTTNSPMMSASKSFMSASSTSKPGKTIVNDNLTPNPKSTKTYEFNFELNVSMDADVIVNVNRKKRKSEADNISEKKDDTPVPRVRIRKLSTTPAKEKNSKAPKRAK